MKTPSFLELKTLVELFSEELESSQLQEIHSTDDGLVLCFYRFQKNPRSLYLVFDLDKAFPFLGLYDQNPWGIRKKPKPLGLFLNAHVKNQYLSKIEVLEKWGRVIQLSFIKESLTTHINFLLIPKQTNLIVEHKGEKNRIKSISWYPRQDLAEADVGSLSEDTNQRSIPFMMKQWLDRRGQFGAQAKNGLQTSALSPYEKWKKQKQKDLGKKENAKIAIQAQIEKYLLEPWSVIGEHLKTFGLKNLPPEWSIYIDFEKSVSENMQNCFAKTKAAKIKIIGARERLNLIEAQINSLQNLTEEKFAAEMKSLEYRKNKAPPREVEGRYRKLTLSDEKVICYMGKSAKDNLDLLRKAKAWDYWIHLKDYPSAHAIVHRQKDQVISDSELITCSKWLAKEGLNEKKTKMFQTGVKLGVVIAECRHVRPIKGDKLGRVTYNEAREFLIAL